MYVNKNKMHLHIITIIVDDRMINNKHVIAHLITITISDYQVILFESLWNVGIGLLILLRSRRADLIISQVTGLVTHSLSLQTREVSSSQAAEKQAFIALMEDASADFSIGVVTTDGHLGIAVHMRNDYPQLTHNQVSFQAFMLSLHWMYLCTLLFHLHIRLSFRHSNRL